MVIIAIVLTLLWHTIHGARMMKYPGEINIGGLFSIRYHPDPSDPTMKCGRIHEIHGIQKLEAALMTFDRINNDTKLLPGVTLGFEVRDTCWSETVALHQSLSFIRGTAIINVSGNSTKLSEIQGGKLVNKKTIMQNPSVIGVIGPSSSGQTLQVQNLLKLFNIPQIGYAATVQELDDKSKYPTYLRIAPCDSIHRIIIRDILIKYNWTYVATVHTSGLVGEGILEHFRNLVEPRANGSGICIAGDRVIESHYNESHFNDIIHEFDNYASVNVVICFCEGEVLRELFKATKRLNLTNRFTFIASDGWGDPNTITHDLEEQAWGTIYVMVHTPKLPSFAKYYTSLKPSKNTRNPWFREFWEDKFDCILPIESVNKRVVNSNPTFATSKISVSRKFCTGNESLAQNYREDRKVYFVMAAIWVMANGLHNMIADTCGWNYTGICPKMYPFDTSTLMNYLMDLSYIPSQNILKDRGKPEPRYDILNFQKLSNNTFEWVQIGDWRHGRLKLDQEFQNREYRNVMSICSLPCSIGYQKIFAWDNKNQGCCWECERCDDYEYVSAKTELCVECALGERPNANRTGCDKIPIAGRCWLQPITVMAVSFTVTGLICTLFTFYIFIKYKDTPIVRASNRELSYLIFVSMILAHSSVFTILGEPSSYLCTIARTLPGISLTMMYAGLFSEMNRIARISAYSKKKFPKKKPRLLSTSSQIAVTLFCVAIETAICFAMILASPSAPMIVYSPRDRPTITCSISVTDAIPPLVLIIFLNSLCIIYALKTRNVPGNFNEAKCMGFAMVMSSITWIVFFTMFFGTPFRTSTLVVCLTLLPSFTLIFLFFPKLYIIIFKPEKNNISVLITSRGMETHIEPECTANIGDPMFEHPINIIQGNNFAIPAHNCKLRRPVAVQTSSKLLRNILSSLKNDEDEESFSDDDSIPITNIFHEFDKNIMATDDNTLEGKNYFSKNTFSTRDKLSSKMMPKSLDTKLNPLRYEADASPNDQSATVSPKSCVELNVNNLPQIGKNE